MAIIVNKDKASNLLHSRLLELLEYNPDSGIFTWKSARGPHAKGSAAGNIQSNGYCQIRIDYKLFLSHRLAWFYCFTEWPEYLIDHIDGNPSNNKLDNLREATQSQNMQNTGLLRTNSSGFRGVSYVKSRNKYEAYISIDNKKKNLGHFNTAEEASIAYLNAANQVRKEYIK